MRPLCKFALAFAEQLRAAAAQYPGVARVELRRNKEHVTKSIRQALKHLARALENDNDAADASLPTQCYEMCWKAASPITRWRVHSHARK